MNYPNIYPKDMFQNEFFLWNDLKSDVTGDPKSSVTFAL